MGVVNLPSGRPTMQLTGGALKRLDALTPTGHEAQIDLTITDEGPMALAFVVISAVPDDKAAASAAARARRGADGGRTSAADDARLARLMRVRRCIEPSRDRSDNTLKSWMKFNLRRGPCDAGPVDCA